MIVSSIVYPSRARGGVPPRVLRGGGGRRPRCASVARAAAPPPRRKMIPLRTREEKKTNAHASNPSAGSSRIVARAASPGCPTPERRSRPCRTGRPAPRPRTASSPDSRTRAIPGATSSWARPPRPRGARASRGRACSSGGTACRRRCTAWAWTRARVATAASLRGGSGGAGERGGGIVSERSGCGGETRRRADRLGRGGARDIASAPARAFPLVSRAETRQPLAVPLEKSDEASVAERTGSAAVVARSPRLDVRRLVLRMRGALGLHVLQ